MPDEEIVLVNVNRLYYRLATLPRSDKSFEAVQIIHNALNNVPARQMFVEMSIKHVKTCFGNSLPNMPFNSFRKRRSKIMKKIINGKKYDTETAKELGCWDNGYLSNDFSYCEETLYRKKTGEYFLHGLGGALTQYSEKTWNGSTGGQVITPLTEYEANRWAEMHLTVDEYESIFGEVEE